MPTGTLARDAATCPVLHLDLAPLNLNLFGLTVHLNQVVLDINAVSGPGNLLGHLLCSVPNLLNGPGDQLWAPSRSPVCSTWCSSC